MRYHVLPMDLKTADEVRRTAERRARVLAASRAASEARKLARARARRARILFVLAYAGAIALCLYFGV